MERLKHSDWAVIGFLTVMIGASDLMTSMMAPGFLIGGAGYGTVWSQSLFWIMWRLLRTAGLNHPTDVAVRGFVTLVNRGIFASCALTVTVLTGRRAYVGALFVAYLVVLVVFPQASSGP